MSKQLAALAILAIAAAAQTHDTAAPALTAYTRSPASVTVTSAPATVTVTYTVTDDLSGIASIQICYPTAPIAACSGAIQPGGALLTYTATATITIPTYTAAGTSGPTITLTDNAGNVATLSGSALSSFTTTLTVN